MIKSGNAPKIEKDGGYPTGMAVDHPAIIEDASFIHFLPDGKNIGKFGLMTRDTQHIGQWEWKFDGMLSGSPRKIGQNTVEWHYDFPHNRNVSAKRTVQLRNSEFTTENFAVTNGNATPILLHFTARLGTGFKGVFEVRADETEDKRAVMQDGDTLSYQRLDNNKVVSTTFEPTKSGGAVDIARERDRNTLIHHFTVTVPAGETVSFGHNIRINHGQEIEPDKLRALETLEEWQGSKARLPTIAEWRREFGIPDFKEDSRIPKAWMPMVTAIDQLHAMMRLSEEGLIFMTGMPNFMCPFGRDQLETILKIMPENEEQVWRRRAVKGMFRFLAANQGKENRYYVPPSSAAAKGIANSHAQPVLIETAGQIVHEMHEDEQSMLGLPHPADAQKSFAEAREKLGTTPYSRFYVMADTTPLFAAVLGEHCHTTQDWDFAHEMQKSMEGALKWMEDPQCGLADEHGFLRYETSINSKFGRKLTSTIKTWKDSHASLVRQDGKQWLGNDDDQHQCGKVAAIEVQGYKYRAYKGAAEIYQHLGDKEKAEEYERKAEKFQESVLKHFITQDRKGKPVYAMAICYPEDTEKMEKLAVHSSNPAHAMWTGVFGDREKDIKPILDSLEDPRHLNSGWGFRTIGASEKAFNDNPNDAYQNGAVWPYEPILRGLKRYAEKGNRQALDLADKASRSLFELGQTIPNHTIPELIGGKERETLARGKFKIPTIPHTACLIQLWSCAALPEALQIRKELNLPDLMQNSKGYSAA